ncbi:uncharacterized protein LOC125026657 [Penaeus chinensis]|uniref:uncharacterized protein LOC125026657 n=1 Tax=Penaeus chinensis TaxID=139456 RepID=UPI001FB7D700|nr:uncharacterized protein LOC125026657 [Penaeus chinensis]
MTSMTCLVTVAVTVTLLQATPTAALNPFQHAFGSLHKAFNPVQRALDRPLSNVGDFHNDLSEQHVFASPPSTTGMSINALFGKLGDVGEGDEASSPTASNGVPARSDSQRVNFNIDTFTFNQHNTRRVDDIFSLLADIEDDPRPVVSSEEPQKAADDTRTEDLQPEEETDDLAVTNAIGKGVLQAAKNMEGVLKVIQKMKSRVEGQSNSSLAELSASNTSASLVDVLLDVPTLEGIRTAGLTAESEAEFLDHLTSVLLGAEQRQQSALTLDPVTIIALLTLAAYLIRAVYQILTVTGRSLDVSDFGLPLSLSDLPDAMVNIHNWISSSQFDVLGESRTFGEKSPALEIPGKVAAILKLQREGQYACVGQFLCQQLEETPLPTPTVSDLFVASLGYFYGQKDLAYYIDNGLSGQGSCNASSSRCSSNTLSDAHTVHSIFTEAVHKFFDLWATVHGRL